MSNLPSAGTPKIASILAIGSELLTPQRLDTNSLIVTEKLNGLGVEVVLKQVIGDDRARLTAAIRDALAQVDILILIGGLGPTEDDLTREAAADALGRKLIQSPEQEAILAARFRQFNRPMALNNLRQTYVIEGAEAIPNPNGTAPGQFVKTARGAMALLPGPPRELRAMLEQELVPRLERLLPKQVIKVRSFRITGIGESDLDTLIAPIYGKYTNPVTTVLSSIGDLWVHLRAHGSTEGEADALLKEVGDPIASVLGERVYSNEGDDTLERVVGRLLRERRATVATTESCTGGMIAARLTDVAGSSDYFIGGYVTYTDKQKEAILGIPKTLIEQHTAVSEPVALAMAAAARRLSGATFGLATTGYAGPTGGTDKEPVGTIYLAIDGPERANPRSVQLRYGADRYRNRLLATQSTLDLLRKTLLGMPLP